MNGFTVIVPAHDQAPAIRGVLENLHARLTALRTVYRTEAIVVDDGSHDATAAVVESVRRERPGWLRLARHERRRGLAAALHTGASLARLTNVIVLDAAGEFEPAAVDALAAELYRSGADCVIASPLMRGGRLRGVPLPRAFGFRLANALLARAAGHRFATLSAPVRAYDTALLRDLTSQERPGDFNAWAIAEMARRKKMVTEIPATLVGGAQCRRASVAEWWRQIVALRRAARLLREARPALRALAVTSPAQVGTIGPV